ncbi:MAG: hypothetical protein MUF23_07595 [Pirellula sp.]|jgi:hypothetical protein|nr:hypothetical protein [Pirellula sp.]
MALSTQEIRELCTAKEWALVQASQPGSIEKLSSTELKKHADNAQKLADKWRDLSRSQARTESRKSGSPSTDTRTHAKYEVFQSALAAFQKQLNSPAAKPAMPESKRKPKPKARNIEARATRQSTRKSLNRTKQSINKTAAASVAAAPAAPTPALAAAPAVATKKVAKKTTKKKTGAKKKTAKKTPAAVAKSRKAATRKKGTVSGLTATPQAQPPKSIVPAASPIKQTSLAGKVKSTRKAIAVRSNKIAGHVSGQTKRTQAKRDAKRR